MFPMSSYRDAIPQVLPHSTQEALRRLAEILRINPAHKKGGDEDLIELMCGVILYLHLDGQHQQEIMRRIYDLPRGPLQGLLVTRVTDVIVNRNWGVWSLPTQELQDLQDFRKVVSAVGA